MIRRNAGPGGAAGELRPEHELVFVYEAQCDDPLLCGREEIVVTESNGETLPARWYTPADIAATGVPLLPEGLRALLNAELSGCSA
jgi:hypothetical protein